MKVEDLLDDLTDLLEDSKELPVVNKTMVDKAQIADIIDEIKANLPAETRQAKAIVADRTKILSDAKKEAEAIISVAEKKRNDMLENNEVVVQARQEAERIVAEAETMAKKVKNAANNYVDNLLERTEMALSANLADFQKKRQSIVQAQRKPGSQKNEE
ncbi:MAG: ATPase [Clostridia bacterium]|nr:ATPase [Clostridia bacterium]